MSIRRLCIRNYLTSHTYDVKVANIVKFIECKSDLFIVVAKWRQVRGCKYLSEYE